MAASASKEAGSRHRACLIDLLIITAVFVVVCAAFLREVYSSALPGGWDGVSHYAIADLYARNLFPRLSGWVPEYFAGMPFPDFYPPAFYFLVALLAKLGLSTRGAYLVVESMAALGVPLLSYLCARRLSGGSRLAGLVTGALAVGYMMSREIFSAFGISLLSIFEAGLATQTLGHCFVLLFYYHLLRAHTSARAMAYAALYLGLVPLTNVHMVWVAAVMAVSLVAVNTLQVPGWRLRVALLQRYAVVALLGLLLSSVWVLPMLSRLDYVPTLSLPAVPHAVLLSSFVRLLAYLVVAGALALAVRNRQAGALIAGMLVLLVLALLQTSELPVLKDLPIQPIRLIATLPFLIVILIGFTVHAAAEFVDNPRVRQGIAVGCVVVFFLRFDIVTSPNATLTKGELGEYQNALNALPGPDGGRVIGEMGVSDFNSFALQSLIANTGAHSLTTVFRESSISVLFTVPLRNLFSHKQETFGVDSKLAHLEVVATPEANRARLRLFNTRHVVANSDVMKRKLTATPGVSRTSPTGSWELYTYSDLPSAYAEVPAFMPVLTFAPFSVKRRQDFGFDFVRLGEELFAAGKVDIPLVLAKTGLLEEEPDMERFAHILVTEGGYRDVEGAYAVVETFSRDRHVILLDWDDPLVSRVKRELGARPTVHIVATAEQARYASEQPEQALQAASAVHQKIIELLYELKTPVVDAPKVTGTTVDGGAVSVQLSKAPDRPTPIWIKQTYSPGWQSTLGDAPYMATPTFQLIFSDRLVTTLECKTAPLHRLADGLSALALLALVIVVWRARRQGAGLVPRESS